MAIQEQIDIIKKGTNVWNSWRNENHDVEIDLYEADLTEINLNQTLIDPIERLKGGGMNQVNLDNAELGRANFSNAQLISARFQNAALMGANFSGANLAGANFYESDLLASNFVGANLSGASFEGANLISADLSGANLLYTNFTEAKLNGTNFQNCKLINTNLTGTILYRTNFRDAELTRVNLQFALLIETKLHNSILEDCKIYGISAWNLRGTPKDQSNLVITRNTEGKITVDDLQVAQFIYLLLNNKVIRNVIDTITSKAVLILGRFTPERKEVLDIIRQELHKKNYVPILFDFENSENQSLLETIMTLAGMARFIIADVTDATMVREEIRSIVEKYPSKPIQPILLNFEKEYVVLPEMAQGFKSLLKTFIYKDNKHIVSDIESEIIYPAESWLERRRNEILGEAKSIREIQLELQIEALKKELNEAKIR